MMLASFMVSSFATQPPGFITGLLLMEIGLTFGRRWAHPVRSGLSCARSYFVAKFDVVYFSQRIYPSRTIHLNILKVL